MTDIICPLCGKTNPSELDECQYCQAPLKTEGFISPADGESQPVSPFTEAVSKQGEQGTKTDSTLSLEQAVPDWLKETEAGFLAPSEPKIEEPGFDQVSEEIKSLINTPPASEEPTENAIDDDWLAGLLAEAGAFEATPPEAPSGEVEGKKLEEEAQETVPEQASLENPTQPESQPAILTTPAEKPDWLADLEAASKIKLEGGMFASEQAPTILEPIEVPEEKGPEPAEQPEWLTQPVSETPAESPQEPGIPQEQEAPQEQEIPQGPESPQGLEAPISPAEIPGWLEALRPFDSASPSRPVEDVSGADIVTAGPLMGLRGVISAQPSAIRVQKPPTYSIKLRVTEEQQSRLQMMEEMLADEGKPMPLPGQPLITSRYIFRLIVAIVLLFPIIWMVVSNRQQSSIPQPGDVPGVIDFTQHIQSLTANAPVLVAFDYEAGFSGEMNTAISNVFTQLIKKNAYLALVATTPSGPALAESMVRSASSALIASVGTFKNYANLGYIPGSTIGLLGLTTSPRSILPFALDEKNVWAATPLKSITTLKDFAVVLVITNDPDTARTWIEQVGPQLQAAGTPLLLITSSQAGPLVRPYYEATPAQVQGLLAGLTGGVAYASAVGNYQPNGVWDAYSAGVTISILIILIGSVAGVVIKMLPAATKKGD